jgi:hypothetical protein
MRNSYPATGYQLAYARNACRLDMVARRSSGSRTYPNFLLQSAQLRIVETARALLAVARDLSLTADARKQVAIPCIPLAGCQLQELARKSP